MTKYKNHFINHARSEHQGASLLLTPPLLLVTIFVVRKNWDLRPMLLLTSLVFDHFENKGGSLKDIPRCIRGTTNINLFRYEGPNHRTKSFAILPADRCTCVEFDGGSNDDIES